MLPLCCFVQHLHKISNHNPRRVSMMRRGFSVAAPYPRPWRPREPRGAEGGQRSEGPREAEGGQRSEGPREAE